MFLNAWFLKHCKLMWSSMYWKENSVFFCCFFYPYKTTKRKKKKKRKAFNWYKNTYINQATFHYLFINHIHISKIEPLALPPSLRTKKKPSQNKIKQYCLTFFCTPKLAFILDGTAYTLFFFFFRQEGKSRKTI